MSKDTKDPNPFLGDDDYCCLSVNTLRGTSLLKAVKQTMLANEAAEHRVGFIFKIDRSKGTFVLTEISASLLIEAETEMRALANAATRYASL